MSYSQIRKFVREAKLETNNADIDALFKMATRGGAINMYGKKDMIHRLKNLQRLLERLDPSYAPTRR